MHKPWPSEDGAGLVAKAQALGAWRGLGLFFGAAINATV
jgi:hypothetical protein